MIKELTKLVTNKDLLSAQLDNILEKINISKYTLLCSIVIFLIYSGLFTPLHELQKIFFENKSLDIEQIVFLSVFSIFFFGLFVYANFIFFKKITTIKALVNTKNNILKLTDNFSDDFFDYLNNNKNIFNEHELEIVNNILRENLKRVKLKEKEIQLKKDLQKERLNFNTIIDNIKHSKNNIEKMNS